MAGNRLEGYQRDLDANDPKQVKLWPQSGLRTYCRPGGNSRFDQRRNLVLSNGVWLWQCQGLMPMIFSTLPVRIIPFWTGSFLVDELNC